MSHKVSRDHIVNETDRVVVSMSTECDNTVLETINRCSFNTTLIAHALHANPTMGIMDANEMLKGVARCRDDDDFNAKTGMEIADSKLMKKYHRRLSKDYEKMIREMHQAIAEMEEMREFHNKKAEAIEADFERMYLQN